MSQSIQGFLRGFTKEAEQQPIKFRLTVFLNFSLVFGFCITAKINLIGVNEKS